MDFSEVIEELKLINIDTKALSKGQIDLIQLTEETNNRLDTLNKSLGSMIQDDREDEQRARADLLKAGKNESRPDNTPESRATFGLLGDAILGIGALGVAAFAAATSLTRVWPDISDTFDELETNIDTFLGGLVGFAQGLRYNFGLGFIPNVIKMIGSAIMTGIRSVVSGIRTAFGSVSKLVIGARATNLIASILNWLRPVTRAFNIVRDIGLAVYRGFRPFIRIFTGILGTIGRFFPMLRGFVILFETLGGAFAAWRDGGDIIDIFRGGLEGFLGSFVTLWSDLGNLVANVAEWVMTSFLGFSEEDASRVGDSIRGVVDGVSNVVNTLISLFGDIVESTFRFFGDLIEDPSGTISDLLDNLMSGIVDGFVGYFNFTLSLWRSLIADGVRLLAGLVPDWLPGSDRIRSGLEGFANGISERTTQDIFSDGVSNVMDLADAMWDGRILDQMERAEADEDLRRRAERRQAEAETTARSSENIDMRPSERAQIVAINAPTVNQTNVQTNNRQNTVVSAPPAVRDSRYVTVR